MHTKEKILQASIRLFNEHGVASIRLQQIADEIGISVGNLAYHYRNKEAIVQSVYEKLFEDFHKILGNYLQNPNLLDFDIQISKYFIFFKEYQFYITDLFSNEHPIPEIRERWRQMINKMILQIKKRLDFHIKRGDLLPASQQTYNILSENLGLTLIFWVPQQQIRQEAITETRYKAVLWNTIKPYLTPKGRHEFENIIVPISSNF